MTIIISLCAQLYPTCLILDTFYPGEHEHFFLPFCMHKCFYLVCTADMWVEAEWHGNSSMWRSQQALENP